MEIRILFFEGCPNAQRTHERVVDLLGADALDTITMQPIADPAEAEREGMNGSPTILVDGVDPFADADTRPSWSCRVRLTGRGLSGAPSDDQLASVLSR